MMETFSVLRRNQYSHVESVRIKTRYPNEREGAHLTLFFLLTTAAPLLPGEALSLPGLCERSRYVDASVQERLMYLRTSNM